MPAAAGPVVMERNETLAYLRARRPVIAPSLLKCDYGRLGQEIGDLAGAGAPLLHWDVMDGHFVPNLSYGAMVIAGNRSASDAPYEAHLMVREPGRYLDDYLAAGVEVITFHIEAVPDPAELLGRIHGADRVAGLAINPETPVSRIAPHFSECDLLLVMSVHPGFGGQSFLSESLPKVAEIRRLAPGHMISIDGGIDVETIGPAAAAGADLFVAGSAIFEADRYDEAISELCRRASEARESSPA